MSYKKIQTYINLEKSRTQLGLGIQLLATAAMMVGVGYLGKVMGVDFSEEAFKSVTKYGPLAVTGCGIAQTLIGGIQTAILKNKFNKEKWEQDDSSDDFCE